MLEVALVALHAALGMPVEKGPIVGGVQLIPDRLVVPLKAPSAKVPDALCQPSETIETRNPGNGRVEVACQVAGAETRRVFVVINGVLLHFGRFRGSVRDGVFVRYQPDGRLDEIASFCRDVPTMRARFAPNGKPTTIDASSRGACAGSLPNQADVESVGMSFNNGTLAEAWIQIGVDDSID